MDRKLLLHTACAWSSGIDSINATAITKSIYRVQLWAVITALLLLLSIPIVNLHGIYFGWGGGGGQSSTLLL